MRRIRQYPSLDVVLDVLHFALYFGGYFPLAILWQIIARDIPRAVIRRRGSPRPVRSTPRRPLLPQRAGD
jgi:hypothetical protein